jgi:hypothetical protein
MVTFEIVVEDTTAKCWYKLINLQTTLIERDCKGSFAAARICLGFSSGLGTDAASNRWILRASVSSSFG